MRKVNLTVSKIEFNAILAGLRQLQQALERPDGFGTYDADILTNGGDEKAITPEEIDTLCERINTGG
jgi:hypothetical protein